jgi:large subunit ribosomal protein L33
MAKKGIYLYPPYSYLSHRKECSRQNTLRNWKPLTQPRNTAKSRTIAVRLISMALTGYYKTLIRPRQHRPLSMLKYDPVGKFLLHPANERWRDGEEADAKKGKRKMEEKHV